MTWYDHETSSIWSQPWGRALTGPLKGTQLKLIPYSLVPWKTWKTEHPNTLALITEGYAGQQLPSDGFVVGVAIGEAARAYPYTILEREPVVTDELDGIPLVIHTNPDTRSVHIFVSQLSDGTRLTFTGDAEQLIDDQTGSRWNPMRGLAIEGELRGSGLREIPWISSFDWAWIDFYPHSDFYAG